MKVVHQFIMIVITSDLSNNNWWMIYYFFVYFFFLLACSMTIIDNYDNSKITCMQQENITTGTIKILHII